MARPYAELRGLMRTNDDTQRDIARMLLVTPAAISQRMNNHAEWKLNEMYAILDRYRVPHDQLNRIFPKDGKRIAS